MERKIGEIFEFGGEWYQCVVAIQGCRECSFRTQDYCTRHSECFSAVRSDGISVIFKKLEKVGEPYAHYCPSGRIIYFQRYKIFNKLYSHNTEYIMYDFNEDSIVSIELKQNKENMEEKKLNLKPFDIQKAREGKPVCTRDGRKARIICFDAKRKDEKSIIALVPSKEYVGFEDLIAYPDNGNYYGGHENDGDLMMLPEKKEGWVNVYKGIDGITFSKHPYPSKEEAIKSAGIMSNRIDTVKIYWEE